MAVYDSYDRQRLVRIGGTSLAAPCWAGLIAIADQFARGADAQPSSPRSDGPLRRCTPCPTRTPSGTFTTSPAATTATRPATGYDMATGIGTPIANVLVPALAPSPPPDLTVSMTDSGSGDFHPGDVGDTFTITVTNAARRRPAAR